VGRRGEGGGGQTAAAAMAAMEEDTNAVASAPMATHRPRGNQGQSRAITCNPMPPTMPLGNGMIS
jgi:hypothetical protein